MAHTENPFPATPVTTFGVSSTTPANLKYMRDARKLLVEYLQAYPSTGMTVDLRGAHGSGKTFLLSWLAEQAAAFASAPCRVIYAKADSPSFIDLYQQLMLRITRDDLIKITREALRRRAEETTGLAKATKVTSNEIHDGDLDTAYASKAIDPNELNLWLRRALEEASSSPDVGRRVAAALGLLDDSTWGEAAFDWLSGHATPLPNESLRAPLFEASGSNPDEGVVAVLEVLAVLFRLAATPLVILVDQLENLVPVAGAVAQTSSILKKLLEHLSLQGAMFVLAGTPPAWKRLPRDVRPRIAKRLTVGNLSGSEARNLLKAYLREIPISVQRAGIIFRIAGGNPREILQTAYQVFEETGGRFRRASEDLIRGAAAKAGTLVDREQAALEILEQAARDESIEVYRPTWQEAADLDRLALAPRGGSLAIVFAVSSDGRAEAELALRLTRLKRELAGEPSAPEMLVVAIGYSSDRVRALLSDISRVLFFNEANFAEELKSEFAKLARPPGAATAHAPPVDEALLNRLDKLEHLLSDLQQTRVESDEETAQRFSALTEASAAPERQRTEIRTRIELRDGLDELSEALADQNLALERSILRSLLVANEANVGNESFDLLGTIYLDALDTAQLAMTRFRRVHDRAGEVKVMDAIEELQSFRSDLTRQLRQALSPSTTRTLDQSGIRVVSYFAIGLGGALAVYFASPALLDILGATFVTYGEARLWVLGLTAMGFAVFVAIGYALVEYLRRPERRYMGLSRYLDRLRTRNTFDRPED